MSPIALSADKKMEAKKKVKKTTKKAAPAEPMSEFEKKVADLQRLKKTEFERKVADLTSLFIIY